MPFICKWILTCHDISSSAFALKSRYLSLVLGDFSILTFNGKKGLFEIFDETLATQRCWLIKQLTIKRVYHDLSNWLPILFELPWPLVLKWAPQPKSWISARSWSTIEIYPFRIRLERFGFIQLYSHTSDLFLHVFALESLVEKISLETRILDPQIVVLSKHLFQEIRVRRIHFAKRSIGCIEFSRFLYWINFKRLKIGQQRASPRHR
jgi:hypothetical protein